MKTKKYQIRVVNGGGISVYITTIQANNENEAIIEALKNEITIYSTDTITIEEVFENE